MCDLSTEETATLWQVEQRKARVAHQCDSCGRAIAPGEHYQVTSALFDHSWTTEKACAWCATIANEFGREHRFTPSASTLWEYLNECAAHGDDEAAAMWRPAEEFIADGQREARGGR